MNKVKPHETDHYKSLWILDELSGNDSLTQRDLSKRLGIALGLVNSYIRNLMKKGYITVRSIPPKRYIYYLTPKGFAEKTRLTYHLLNDYTRIYREARENIRKVFYEMRENNVEKIVFAGADEIAEIAYITLQEADMKLAGVIDDQKAGRRFFGLDIKPLDAAKDIEYDHIVVTSYLHRERIYKKLLNGGLDGRTIRTIFK